MNTHHHDDNDGAAEINRLRLENKQLKARLADAEGEGCTLHGHAKHGKEAEELRSGIEKLLREPRASTGYVFVSSLHKLLDRVVARDSLAHVRANAELRDARKTVARLERMLLRVNDVLAEAWVDQLGDTDGPAPILRDAFRALGVKLSMLPKPIQPAGAKRGRHG